MDALCMKMKCAEEYNVPEDATLVINGQALVMSIGRPQMSHTFEDFATVFLNVVHQYGLPFARIDVVFDRYDRLSTKEGTRTNNKKGKSIRSLIETPDVPLRQDWQGFLSNPRNKAGLANFLSHELLRRAPASKCVITTGGLDEDTMVLCNMPDLDMYSITSTYEESDTRLVLHCAHMQSPTVEVWCRDTDVLLMLIALCHDQQGDIYIYIYIWRRGQVRSQSTFMWMNSSHLGNLVLKRHWH